MFEGVRWRKSRILNSYSFAFWPFLSVSQSEPTQLLLLSELILLKCQILSLTFKCLFLWCFFEVKRGCSAMFSQGCFCRLIRQEFKSGVSARLRCRGSNLSSLFFYQTIVVRSFWQIFLIFSGSFRCNCVCWMAKPKHPNTKDLLIYWTVCICLQTFHHVRFQTITEYHFRKPKFPPSSLKRIPPTTLTFFFQNLPLQMLGKY